MKTSKNALVEIKGSVMLNSAGEGPGLCGSAVKTIIDPKEFRNACGAFSTGVTVVTAKALEGAQGMTANGFMSVSLDPALVVISVGNNQKIHKTITESGGYGVSVLGASQVDVSDHFGGKPNPDLSIGFTDLDKTPYLSKNIAYYLVKVKSAYVEGDHTLFVGEVYEFGASHHEQPLLFSKGQYKNIG